MTVNHWVAGSSPAGGAKYRKSCQQWRLFFGPMISSLSVNHWRKQCFRLVRAQQAEPNIEKAVSNGGFFFGPMISSLSVNHWRKQCFRLVRAQQAEPNIEKAASNGGFFLTQ